jgi:hypothetical protein
MISDKKMPFGKTLYIPTSNLSKYGSGFWEDYI